MVSPQSEVGKLNEGSKGQGIHIPLTQQISLQFKGNEAAQTFDRKKCALHHCLSPELFRAKTAVHYNLRAFNLHPFSHMNHASSSSSSSRISFAVASISCHPDT